MIPKMDESNSGLLMGQMPEVVKANEAMGANMAEDLRNGGVLEREMKKSG